MDTISMNSRNSKTYQSYRLLLSFTDKINLKEVISMLICQSLACTAYGIIYKKVIKNNKLKISTPIWNKKFELPDGS